VPPGAKSPNRSGWQDERMGIEDVPRFFDNGQNVRVLNGRPSGWRVCADLETWRRRQSWPVGSCLRHSPPVVRDARTPIGG
jgi:hypothetical protein